MQLTVSSEFTYRYWNQVHAEHENLLSISLESEQKQCRESLREKCPYLELFWSDFFHI